MTPKRRSSRLAGKTTQSPPLDELSEADGGQNSISPPGKTKASTGKKGSNKRNHQTPSRLLSEENPNISLADSIASNKKRNSENVKKSTRKYLSKFAQPILDHAISSISLNSQSHSSQTKVNESSVRIFSLFKFPLYPSSSEIEVVAKVTEASLV